MLSVSMQLYRLEQGQDCLALYSQLMEEATDERHEERQTNYLAAAVLAQSTTAKVETRRRHEGLLRLRVLGDARALLPDQTCHCLH